MTCQKKELVFELTFAEKKEMVYADYSKIQQVLYNLIDNALKFSNPKSSIAIRTGIRGQKVFVSIKDTGIGIPPDQQDRVFERFSRVDKSHSKASGGTGLGLSIVKHAVQYHHGTIHLQSEVGKGTEIRVTFPLA